jgi:hypothetical protein
VFFFVKLKGTRRRGNAKIDTNPGVKGRRRRGKTKGDIGNGRMGTWINGKLKKETEFNGKLVTKEEDE